MCTQIDHQGIQLDRNYLVYEHWRPDTGKCFYVGKGKLKRARSLQREGHHARVVAKLKRSGLVPEIRIIEDGLLESEAFTLEIERIAFWRAAGVGIVNRTNGGDGISGYRHGDATKEKMRIKATGRTMSEETLAKMSASRTGLKRSPETKARMSRSAIKVQSQSRRRVCATKEGRHQMLKIARAAANNPEVCRVRSENAKALWADPAYRAKVMAARCVPKSIVKGFS